MRNSVSGTLAILMILSVTVQAEATSSLQVQVANANGQLAPAIIDARLDNNGAFGGGTVPSSKTASSGSSFTVTAAIKDDVADPAAQSPSPNTQTAPPRRKHFVRDFIIVFALGAVLLIVLASAAK